MLYTLQVNILAIYLGVTFVSFVVYELGAQWAYRSATRVQPTKTFPSVSLVKPVYGADAFTKQAFLSWIQQEYNGEYQILFSLQDESDPALKILEELKSDPTVRPFEVLIHPIFPGFHGKTSNLLYGVAEAKNEILVLSDADIVAPPGALKKLVGKLESGFDLVSCMIRHTQAENLWARLYAYTWNFVIFHGTGVAIERGIGPFLVGGTVGIRASTLAGLGGVEAFGGYVVDDLRLGQLAYRAGVPRGLGGLLESPVGSMTLAQWKQKLSRASTPFRQLPGWPVTQLLFGAWFYGYLLVLPLLFFGGSSCMKLVCLAYVLGRWLMAGFVNALVRGSYSPGFEFLWADICFLYAIAVSLFVRDVTWAGVDYRLGKGGRLEE